MVTTTTVIPSADDIREAASAVYAAEGYVREDGTRDTGKVIERLAQILQASPVTSKADRKAKAVTRDMLTDQVFPTAPGQDAWAEQDNPRIAEEVWKQLRKDVWSFAAFGSSSKLQTAVRTAMGNGYAVCRTAIGGGADDAVYITDNFECIRADWMEKRQRQANKANSTLVQDELFLMRIRPDDAPTIRQQGIRFLKGQLQSGTAQLNAAIEAGNSNGSGTEPGTDEA